MSTASQRVDLLIQEHSRLNRPQGAQNVPMEEQSSRITEIRQELVQIFQPVFPKE